MNRRGRVRMNTGEILKEIKKECKERMKYEYPYPISFAKKTLWILIYQALKFSNFLAMYKVSEMLYRAYREMYMELKKSHNIKYENKLILEAQNEQERKGKDE